MPSTARRFPRKLATVSALAAMTITPVIAVAAPSSAATTTSTTSAAKAGKAAATSDLQKAVERAYATQGAERKTVLSNALAGLPVSADVRAKVQAAINLLPDTAVETEGPVHSDSLVKSRLLQAINPDDYACEQTAFSKWAQEHVVPTAVVERLE